MAVNKVILVGNVGKDPETRYLDENTAVCKFSLATSEVYKNRNGEKVEQTEWHNIVLWRGLAQVAEKYVKKGSQLFIEGRIKSRSYDDKDGIKRYITEIVGDNMQMLGRKQDESEPGNYASPSEQTQNTSQPEQTPTQPTQDQIQKGPDASNESNDNNSGPAGDPDDLPF
jgi:single-strand DNA-binding protein